MRRYKRIFLIVMDSLGIGAMPDSMEYGDEGVDTFGHILDRVGKINIPNLKRGRASLRTVYADGGGQPQQRYHDRTLGNDGAESGKAF